jgi:CRISPR/Cas system-associated exonuclease Cas4 (RecB family)
MTLPDDFLFSQSSLQDYVDCQRRFQLRYMLHQAWPAVEAEPYLENERLIDRGARFHKIVRQHLVGVPATQISASLSDDELIEGWWGNWVHEMRNGNLRFISEAGNQCYEEISLSVPVGKFLLVAKYDLLVINSSGKLVILDWKTSHTYPSHKWLADRLQTHVYPYVLSTAAATLLAGNTPDLSQIEMLYWFTNHPEQPERFTYDQARYKQDERYLTNLVSTIDHKNDEIFPLTPDERRCNFCTYRSLCNRGITAGDLQHLEGWQDAETSEEVSIDFDQIGEIEF